LDTGENTGESMGVFKQFSCRADIIGYYPTSESATPMAKKTTPTSVSLTTEVLQKARKRSSETDRGNLSAYVERLIQRDIASALRAKARAA
jgi:hypothetical protein